VAKAKTIIGWREWVAFPDWGLPGIRAKVDTGAKTSAIHAHRPEAETRDGVPGVRFAVHPRERHRAPELRCWAPLVDERRVTSSNGRSELRRVVRTRITLGHLTFRTQLTLTNRDAMGFRVLLGRDTLKPRWIVDPAASFTLGEMDIEALYAPLDDSTPSI
jgi:hypothetical protein